MVLFRYNTGSSGHQGQTGNVGSCSPLNNGSDAGKQSNSDPLNQNSNSSSNNNNRGSTVNRSITKPPMVNDKAQNNSSSVFQSMQSSHLSNDKVTATCKHSTGQVNVNLLQENDTSTQQHTIQHHHLYHQHNGQKQQMVPAQDEMSKSKDGTAPPQCGSSNTCRAPAEVNVANCSLNGSASGSNHGSNIINESSAVVNVDTTNMVTDSGVAPKDGVDNGGSGSGSGSSVGVDQCRLAQREAALNKFRQKRKERCFDKKVILFLIINLSIIFLFIFSY